MTSSPHPASFDPAGSPPRGFLWSHRLRGRLKSDAAQSLCGCLARSPIVPSFTDKQSPPDRSGGRSDNLGGPAWVAQCSGRGRPVSRGFGQGFPLGRFGADGVDFPGFSQGFGSAIGQVLEAPGIGHSFPDLVRHQGPGGLGA